MGKMRRILLGLAIGGALATLLWVTGDSWVTGSRIAAIQSADPEEWFIMHSLHVRDTPDTFNPVIDLDFEVFQPVEARATITPINVETGDTICEGRTRPVVYEEPLRMTTSVSVAALAGLESCEWPPGRYKINMTLILKDYASNIRLKEILEESNVFTVGDYNAQTK